MRYHPTQSELVLLQHMAEEERFHFATTRIIECEEVWSLGDEESGWLLRDVGERQVISIWPYQVLAEEMAAADEGATTLSISLEHFLYGVLSKCREAEIDIELAPNPGTQGRLISAAELFEVLNSMVEAGEYFMEG